MTRPDDADSTRLAAIAGFMRASVRTPSSAELAQGLDALRARLTGERQRQRLLASRRRGLLVALASSLIAAALVTGVILVHSRLAKRPVAVAHVEGGKLSEGGYLSDVGKSGMRLYFSEGSQFNLTPGTRGRLLSVTAEGARFVLDHGTASFRITPNLERHWRIEAGPFLVSVHGTAFTVLWDPSSERFEVALREGRVAVAGPVLGESLVLRPGQTLTVDLPHGKTVISEAGGERGADPSAAQVAPSASVAVAPSLAPSQPSAAAAVTAVASNERRWRKALAKGEWDSILADVERDGVEQSLRKLSSDDLLALADAARYRRRTDLARGALLAVRERFPQSQRALDAIFLLGRVEEARQGGKGAAIERYEEYLARAPAGTYAAEALGRKMILVKDVEGPSAARLIADEYLRRFPRGSYAEAARALQRIP